MNTFSVIDLNGKQYLVKKGDQLLVEHLSNEVNAIVEFPALMSFDSESKEVHIGEPELKSKISVKVLEHLKGDKLRVAKFKSKVRYRKVRGFRPDLTRIEIILI